jgi:hypothetical protein
MLKNAKSYCSRCKDDSTDDVRIVWNPKKIGHELYIDGAFVSKLLLRKGLIELEKRISNSIQKLFFDVQLSKYLKSVEDILNNGAGLNQFSFDSLLDIPAIKKLSLAFIEQLAGSEQFQNEFLYRGSLSTQSMKKYLARSSKLCQQLLCAMHVSSGLPGRATEIQTLKLRKEGGFSNNLWILNGRLVTITYYNKTAANINESRPIVRVLPERLSILFLLYIVCVRNIER